VFEMALDGVLEMHGWIPRYLFTYLIPTRRAESLDEMNK
jgi:hypothetical protein